MRRLLAVYGTRPEAIKMAPLLAAAREHERIGVTTVVTGQHREMLDQVNSVFNIHPDYDLDIMRLGAGLASLSASVLTELGPILEKEDPDVVVVQGDTTSAFVSGLAAFYRHIPVVHLEAGLRTHNLSNPFPEEGNRRLLTSIATLHLAPTATARGNLSAEGIKSEDIVVTGNTVIDALKYACGVTPHASAGSVLGELIDADVTYVLVTAHRRESWGTPMAEAATAIATLAKHNPGVQFLFPLHRNQTVRDVVEPILGGLSNVRLTEPLDYIEFVLALQHCRIVLTDSGGIQEEAPSLGKPVLVMRDTTERPEAVTAGTARLVGTRHDAIVSAVQNLLSDSKDYRDMATAVNPYGDGRAAVRSLAAIEGLLGIGRRLPDFVAGV